MVGVDASGGTTTLQGRSKTPRGLHEPGARQYLVSRHSAYPNQRGQHGHHHLKVLPRFRPLDVIEAPRSEVEPDVLTNPIALPPKTTSSSKNMSVATIPAESIGVSPSEPDNFKSESPKARKSTLIPFLLALDTLSSKKPLRMRSGLSGSSIALSRSGYPRRSNARKGNHVRLVAYVTRRWHGHRRGSKAQESQNLKEDPAPAPAGRPMWMSMTLSFRWMVRSMWWWCPRATNPPNLVFEDASFGSTIRPSTPFQSKASLSGKPLWVRVCGLATQGLLRLPADVGNEENTFMQIKLVLLMHHEYHARRRLRNIAQKNGDVFESIVHQSDSAYILELSDQIHRLIGVQK